MHFAIYVNKPVLKHTHHKYKHIQVRMLENSKVVDQIIDLIFIAL